MFRSARAGRQGRKSNNNQLTHQHVTDSKPTNSKSTETKVSKKSSKSNIKKLKEELDCDQIYDYQANTHSKAVNRLTANQIDDDRLTGSIVQSSSNQLKDEDLDQSNRIDEFLKSYQKGDGNVVHSEDDESIDSDEAMGELDDHQVKSKKNSKLQTKKTRRKVSVRFEDDEEVSQESSENEEDLDDDQFVDASTMLDIGAESDHAFSDEDADEDSDSCQSSSSSSDEEMNKIDLNEDDDDEDESKLGHLAKIVENLGQINAQKRKEADQNDSGDQPADSQAKKRKLLPAQIESRNEGEILPTSGRVNLEDLLTNLSSTPALSELKKSLKPLTASDKPSNKGLMPAPLETRRQQQIERQVAYDLTKKELAKWNETSRLAKGLFGKSSDGKNRFIVAANNLSSADKEPDATRWNMHFKPANNLEAQVSELLVSSQLTSKKLIEEENDDLIAQGIGSQKFKEKVVEAKLARELMFRAERKSKRVAKIKSKAFRRIRKKEKQRKSISGGGGEADIEFMKELDGIDGGDRVQTKKEEMEIERARERVSLKHSSQGKWAKKVAELKGLGSDRNAAIQERIRREELLKKKINGHESGDSDESESEDSEFDSEASVDVDDIKAHALNQLAQIDSKSSNSTEQPLKGLFAMKFMQKAMAAKERQAEEAKEELRQQLLKEHQDESIDEDSAECGMKVQGNLGRMVFGPVEGQHVAESTSLDECVPTKAPPQTTKSSGSHLRVIALDANPSTKDSSPTEHSKSISEDAATGTKQTNPWLALNTSSLGSGTVSRIKDLNSNSKNHHESSTILAEKSKRKADKSKQKQSNEKRAAAQDAQVDINPDVLLGDEINGEVGVKALKQMQSDDPEAHQEAIIRSGYTDNHGRTAFEQRELVQLAFADDQVVAQFHDEKVKQIQNEGPKDVDLTLPGWGDWVGKGGAKKTKVNKKLIKKTAGVEPSERKDSKLSNVIILESSSVKMNNAKKLRKYQLKDIPFPYVNKDQVDLGFNQPIGPEFNTRLNHRHLVRPDVLTRPGVFIHPVENPV